MFEVLIGMGGAGRYLPDSGPGNKSLLFGNTTLGYFGEVTAHELFDGYEVAAWGPLTGNVITPTGLVWLKFIRNNKVVYIAKTPIASGLSWNDLYNAGLVYGTRGNGLYPIGAGVEQFNPKKKIDVSDGRTWWLAPRLIQGMNVDPFTQSSTSWTQMPESIGSEWDDLILRTMTYVTDNSNGTKANGTSSWGTYTTNDLLTRGDVAKETHKSNVLECIARGYVGGGAAVMLSAKATTGLFWRPCLELTDVNGVPLIINDAGGLLGGNLLDPILQNQDITDSAVRMVQITYDLSALVSPPLLKDEAFFNAATRVTGVGSSISALSFFYPDPSIVDPSLQIQALDSSISALSPFTAKAGYIADLADTIIPATDYGVFTVSP